jgi:hypothetical protein
MSEYGCPTHVLVGAPNPLTVRALSGEPISRRGCRHDVRCARKSRRNSREVNSSGDDPTRTLTFKARNEALLSELASFIGFQLDWAEQFTPQGL